jgi:transcriptional regulator of acetoin/glycerol metabolism
MTTQRRRPYVEARIRALTGMSVADALPMALIKAGYHVAKAAEMIEVDRSTFYRLCKRYGIRVARRASVVIEPTAA